MARSVAEIRTNPYFVYVLRNEVTGRYYVGQTKDFSKRLAYHRKNIKWVIGRAIRKHGIANFSHFVNEVPECLADRFETNLISLFGSLAPNGYNIESGGNRYKKMSDESRRKNSEAHIGKRPTEETRRKLSEALRRRVRTAETGRRISEAKKGRKLHPLSPEHRAKLSAAFKGRYGPWTGKHHSEETRKKMSVSQSERRKCEAAR